MADVFGTIGNEQVELHNAATEATLRLLLQATLTANRQNLSTIQQLAAASGLNPASTQSAATRAATASTTQFSKVLDLGSLNIKQFFDGTATATTGLNSLSSFLTQMNMPMLGRLARGFQLVAQYQEENLKTYQQISSIGAHFGGSLTDMRLAATNTYMTLEEFGSVVTKNGEALARLGGGTEDGVRAFAKLSKSLIDSEFGKNLLAMGLTTKDVNEGMLSYIAATGGRTSAELKNKASTDKLTESAAIYMENLDALSRLTGKSKEAQQEELNAASKNAAWQAKLQSMDEKTRSKAMLGLQNALAIGGKGAADAFQSEIMGIAPDKAGQQFIALGGEVANSVRKSASITLDGTKKDEDMRKNFRDGLKSARNAMDKYSQESVMALIRSGGPLAETLQTLGVTANNLKGKTDEEIDAIMKKAELQNTEAEQITDANKNMKDFTQALNLLVAPIVTFLTPAIKSLASVLGSISKWFTGLEDNTRKVISTFAALAVGAGLMFKMFSFGRGGAGSSAAGGAGGGIGGALSGLGRGVGGALRGVAGGIRAFASPQVMLGAIGFGVAIAAIGAGIAAASWLTGKALPTLAEGLSKIQELDGEQLGSVAMGIGKVGLGLAPFALSGVLLIPAAFGVNMLADSLLKLNSIDVEKLLRLASAMEKVNAATPTVGQTLKSGFSNLVQKVTGGSAQSEKENVNSSSVADNTVMLTELRKLNSTSVELLRNMKDVVEYSKRNVDATKNLNGNLFMAS